MKWSNKAIKATEKQLKDTHESRNLLGMCIVNFFYSESFEDEEIIEEMKTQNEIKLTIEIIKRINDEVKRNKLAHSIFKNTNLNDNLLS